VRFIAILFGLALGAAALFIDASVPARADEGAASAPAAVLVLDAGGPAAAQPGSDAEARDYELREAQSPEAQEFVGGHHGGFIFAVFLIALLVVLVLYLSKEGKI
jgi:hypothetical protein